MRLLRVGTDIQRVRTIRDTIRDLLESQFVYDHMKREINKAVVKNM